MTKKKTPHDCLILCKKSHHLTEECSACYRGS